MTINRILNLKIWILVLVLAVTILILRGVSFGEAVETDLPALLPEQAEKETATLLRELRQSIPKGHYIVIDTASNRIYVKKGEEIVFEAACSTGSGRTLVGPERAWTFETPRGEFRIQNKVVNPLWRKPDWAFLEEGEPVPSDESKRFERNALGEYALGIGNGYFIHGTLYTRMLGQNVTHGCVRLGSEDLRKLVRLAPVGTRVFIL